MVTVWPEIEQTDDDEESTVIVTARLEVEDAATL
jgi:hypothetical protein